ncbi:MAG: filamentation induced By protein Fic, partial [Myxococcaceae bacterium]|nr:filamentation induced By protein Fic [Myxococcaceae bacterium]
LFYWAALRHGYWMFEFISISRVLLRSPTDYYRAFLFAETDHNDATYFLLHQARVIEEAVIDLRAWVSNQTKETRRFEDRIKGLKALNHRQQALLIQAVKHPKAELTIQRHRTDQGVVYQTARTDLLDLERRKLLVRTKRGKQWVFKPVENLEQRLERNPK